MFCCFPQWLRGTWDAVTGKRRAGRLRRCDVYITGVPFVPIEWRLVESEMTAFVEWLHTEAVSPTMDRLEFAILAHYRIVSFYKAFLSNDTVLFINLSENLYYELKKIAISQLWEPGQNDPSWSITIILIRLVMEESCCLGIHSPICRR